MIKSALDLLAKNHDLPIEKRGPLPFPMGVFGTLRQGQWNNSRMHNGKVSLHRRAFMPHFIARGLSIGYEKNASAPFEVFFYLPEEWNKMIPRVDSLEGCSMSDFSNQTRYVGGYFRTLAWLHLLPEDYQNEVYNESLGGSRNLKIPPEQWEQYERVPCWVYSSRRQNEAAKDCGTVIWG